MKPTEYHVCRVHQKTGAIYQTGPVHVFIDGDKNSRGDLVDTQTAAERLARRLNAEAAERRTWTPEWHTCGRSPYRWEVVCLETSDNGVFSSDLD